MGICLAVKWFAILMPGNMVVWYSDHHVVNRMIFTQPFEYLPAIQMPGTGNKQVKVHYADVSAIQMFLLFRSPLYTS